MPSSKLTRSQVAALQSLPEGTSHPLPVANIKIAASQYTDPAVFEREKAALFNTYPLIAGPSALLAQANSFHRIDLLGTPILLTRAADGIARAFVNVCRHRGTILCPSHETGAGKKIVCPYHAWTYGLDGKLVGVPRAEAFEGLVQSDYDLVELACLESGGLIWVGLQPGVKPDFSLVQGEIADELDGLGLRNAVIFDKAVYKVNANWKLVMDTMLDSYHVIRLHRETLAPFFVDTPTRIDVIGPHIRSASARKNFTKDRVSEDFNAARRVSVFSYAMFPAGIIVVSPRYISIGVLRPVSADKTEIDYYMVVDSPPPNEDITAKLRQSFDLMNRAFGKEDFWAAELGQEGLSTGTLKDMTLGGMERQMSIFHDILAERMKG